VLLCVVSHSIKGTKKAGRRPIGHWSRREGRKYVPAKPLGLLLATLSQFCQIPDHKASTVILKPVNFVQIFTVFSISLENLSRLWSQFVRFWHNLNFYVFLEEGGDMTRNSLHKATNFSAELRSPRDNINALFCGKSKTKSL
jgi:hypothetical protein